MGPELAELCRGIFEAEVGSQIAAERVTSAIRALVAKLAEVRQLNGWSLQYMAELMEMRSSDYVLIEQGASIPRKSTVKRMMAAFGFEYMHTPVLFTSRPFHRKTSNKKGTRKK